LSSIKYTFELHKVYIAATCVFLVGVLHSGVRLVRGVENWYRVLLYHLGIGGAPILRLRSGLRVLYVPGLFSLEQFVDQPYRRLDVLGRVVLDVGAYVGDSTLYFVSRGAKWVYAFEPYPSLYRIAEGNLRVNGVRNVTLFNEAIGLEDGYIGIDTNYSPKSNSWIRDFGSGVRIHVRGFDSLVENLGLRDAALKMDCEGCEYKALLSAKSATLESFSEIILEYHYQGYKQIVEKLSRCGFKVEILNQDGSPTNEPPQKLGLIFAKR